MENTRVFLVIAAIVFCAGSIDAGPPPHTLNTWRMLTSYPPGLTTRCSVVYNNSYYLFPEGYVNDWDAEPRLTSHVYVMDDIFNFNWRIEYTTGQAPEARDSFCNLVIGDTMFYFGGITSAFKNDLYALDLKTMHWTQLSDGSGMGPTPRRHARCFEVDGYYHIFSGKMPVQFATDMWKYDHDQNTWIRIPYSTSSSPFMIASVYAFYQRVLYVYSGLGGDDTYNFVTNEFWGFDYDSRAWTEYKISGPTGGALPGAYVGAFANVGSKLYFMHGISDFSEKLASPVIYALDLETKSFTLNVNYASDILNYPFHAPAPLPRSYTTSSAFGRYIILSSGEYLCADDSVWIFDTANNDWMPSSLSKYPMGRTKSALAKMSESKVAMFGGRTHCIGSFLLNDLWIYDIDVNSWKLISGITPPDFANPKSKPPPVFQPAFGYFGGRLFLIGGDPEVQYPEDISFYFDINNLRWNWFELQQDVRSFARVAFAAYAMKGSTLYIWGGNATSNHNTGSIVEEVLQFDCDKMTSVLQPSGNLLQRRLEASGFIHNDRFCIQGGLTLNLKPKMDIWCHDKESKAWNMVPGSNDDIEILSSTSFAYAGVGFLAGGENENTDNTNDIWMFDFVNQKWQKHTYPDIRPPPFKQHSTVVLKNWLLVISGKTPEGVENRVIGFDIGTSFCFGSKELDFSEGYGSLDDGSSSFSYVPFTSCSWKVTGVNNLIIDKLDLDEEASLKIRVTSECGDTSIYSQTTNVGRELVLPQAPNPSNWYHIPTSTFVVEFSTSSSYLSKGGFLLQFLKCPHGFVVQELMCICQVNNYITPSGDCYPCESGFSQPLTNMRSCIAPLLSGAAAVASALDWPSAGRWNELPGSVPSCGYVITATLHPSSYVLCLYYGENNQEGQVVPVKVYRVSQPTSLHFDIITTKGTIPPSRKGACVFSKGNLLYYIGGQPPSNQDTSVYILDLNTNTWSRPTQQPSKVTYAGHTCIDVGEMFYFHGGELNDNILDTLHVYEIGSGKWTTLVWLDSPTLTNHVGWFHDGKVYLYGGFDGIQEYAYVYVSSQDGGWESPRSLAVARCVDCFSEGVESCKLRRQSMGYVVKLNMLYISGGLQGQTTFRDLLVIDIDTLELVKKYNYNNHPLLPSTSPPPTYQTSLSFVKDHLLISGGLVSQFVNSKNSAWLFDLSEEVYITADVSQIPPPRSAFALASEGRAVVIFGGLVQYGRDILSNDVWLFDTNSEKWNMLSPHSLDPSTPSPRSNAGAVLHGQVLYIFGGFSNSAIPDRSLWRMNVSRALSGVIQGFCTWEKVDLLVNLQRTQHLFERQSFTSVLIGSRIYVWGGRLAVVLDSLEDYRAVFEIDLTRNTLSAHSPTQASPTPRTLHSSVASSDSFYIFGGVDFRQRPLSDVWSYATGTRMWRNFPISAGNSVQRYQASAIVTGKYVLVVGGFDQSNARRSESFLWSFDESKWLPVSSTSNEEAFPSLAGHQVFGNSTHTYVYGGSTFSYDSNRMLRISPALCSFLKPLEANSTRLQATIRDLSGEAFYPRGTNCLWRLPTATVVVLNASLGHGDKIILTSLAGLVHPQEVLSSDESVHYAVPSGGISVELRSSGKLEDGSSGQGVTIVHARCPSNSVFSTISICECPSGTYEDSNSESCVPCSPDDNRPECPYIESENGQNTELNVAAVAGGISGGVGLLIIIGLFIGKHVRDKLKKITDREQQLYMHVSFTDLQFGRILGSGSFGEVYAGKWRGADVAIKRLNAVNFKREVLNEFDHEVGVMVELRHPNLVLYMAACVQPPNLCIVSELMSRGSLFDALHDDFVEIDISTKLSFLLDAAKGLQYLHLSSPPILHRDLKSPNLLLDQKWNLKISDFGLSGVKTQTGKEEAPNGTLLWMAPEVIQAKGYTTKSDVFSYGIIIWEVITRDYLYPDDIAEAVAVRVANDGYRPLVEKHVFDNPQILALMQECWAQDPTDRPNFSEVIPILTDIEKAVVGGKSKEASLVTSKTSQGPPTGSVFLIFSSVEGMSSLWAQYPEDAAVALLVHNNILRQQIKNFQGYEAKSDRDSFIVSFKDGVTAIQYCLKVQEALLTADWPEVLDNFPETMTVVSKGVTLLKGLRVRMGIHCGEPYCENDPVNNHIEYRGQIPQLASRIGATAKGGQILVTDAVQQQIVSGFSELNSPHIRDIGHHVLRGVVTPVHLYEITSPQHAERGQFYDHEHNSHSAILQPSLPNALPTTTNSSKEDELEWQINFDNLKVSSTELGSGSFGVVFLGEYRGNQVAVKKFMKQKMAEKQYFSFLAEVMLLRELKHPHILEFVGASIRQPNICLILEYAECGSLRDLLSDPKVTFSQHQNRNILCQIADAMKFLHNRKPAVLHRDMKSANVLVIFVLSDMFYASEIERLVGRVCDKKSGHINSEKQFSKNMVDGAFSGSFACVQQTESGKHIRLWRY
eukprot:TRINITY_DN1583_c0_g1_i4.p1 TRINITY_DN1583_c0_g1~~TRINITY_DN1583_c0_g1_i4.p1  ORF type:complete len:2439 (+),score=398.92 TRINITY_DN1583_c0_g1_i4:197-7513(+)